MRRLTTRNGGIPDGLPDRLRRWTIPVDPTLPAANRRAQAYLSFVDFHNELSDFLRPLGAMTSIHRVQKALGMTLLDFWAVADSATTDGVTP